jgi:hypothetical protein
MKLVAGTTLLAARSFVTVMKSVNIQGHSKTIIEIRRL